MHSAKRLSYRFFGIFYSRRQIGNFRIESTICVDPIHQGLSVPLVGRSNVGKSSLFNALVRNSTIKYSYHDLSVVSSIKNTTRDLNHSLINFGGKKCVLFDTGGLDLIDENGIMNSVWEKVKKLVVKSHLILFVLDAQEGITPLDAQIAQFMSKWLNTESKANPKVILPVINKSAPNSYWDSVSEIYELGLSEPVKVCSESFEGIDALKKAISKHLKDCNDDLFKSMDSLYNKAVDFTTAVIERKKHKEEIYEKTTFSPQDATLRASEPLDLVYKPTEPWFINMKRIFGDTWENAFEKPEPIPIPVEEKDVEQEDIEDEYIKQNKHKLIPPVIRVSVVGSRGAGKSSLINSISNSDLRMVGEKFTTTDSGPVLLRVVIKFLTRDATEVDKFIELIDTCPFNLASQLSRESMSKSVKSIRLSHISILCLNKSSPTRKEMKLARNIMKLGKSLIIAVTHSDELHERRKLKNDIQLKLKDVPIIFTNKTGYNSEKMLKTIISTFLDCCKRIPTNLLNEWLRAFVARWPPPWRHGSKCNIKYIAQVKTLPPTFILWSNVYGTVPQNYIFQMKKSLKSQFNMNHSTVKFVMRTTVMPKPGKKLSRIEVLKWKRIGPLQDSVVSNLTRKYRVRRLPQRKS